MSIQHRRVTWRPPHPRCCHCWRSRSSHTAPRTLVWPRRAAVVAVPVQRWFNDGSTMVQRWFNDGSTMVNDKNKNVGVRPPSNIKHRTTTTVQQLYNNCTTTVQQLYSHCTATVQPLYSQCTASGVLFTTTHHSQPRPRHPFPHCRQPKPFQHTAHGRQSAFPDQGFFLFRVFQAVFQAVFQGVFQAVFQAVVQGVFRDAFFHLAQQLFQPCGRSVQMQHQQVFHNATRAVVQGVPVHLQVTVHGGPAPIGRRFPVGETNKEKKKKKK